MAKKKKKIEIEGGEEELTDQETEQEAGEKAEEKEEKKETAAEAEKEETAGEAEEKAEPAGEKPEKKKFFKKEKKDPLKELVAELEDRVKRQMAEFENFRKRTDKEKTEMFGLGAKSVIEKLLPTVDNFERGLQGADTSDPFAEGMEKIYKKLMQDLDELGVVPIEALGKPFDPNLHNAVMQDTEGEGEPGTVTKELQKGYTFKGSVVRHSMVAVKQ